MREGVEARKQSGRRRRGIDHERNWERGEGGVGEWQPMRRSIFNGKQFPWPQVLQTETSRHRCPLGLPLWTDTHAHRLKTRYTHKKLHYAGAYWVFCCRVLIHTVAVWILALEGANLNDKEYKVTVTESYCQGCENRWISQVFNGENNQSFDICWLFYQAFKSHPPLLVS